MRVEVGLWRTRQSCGKRPDEPAVLGEEGIELEGLEAGADEVGWWEGKTGGRWKTAGILGDGLRSCERIGARGSGDLEDAGGLFHVEHFPLGSNVPCGTLI